MTLAADEFSRRCLLHALPRGFHRIRHYGLLASARRKYHLERDRRLLSVAPSPDDDQPADLKAQPLCPCCGGTMIIIGVFERRCLPSEPPYPAPSSGIQAPGPGTAYRKTGRKRVVEGKSVTVRGTLGGGGRI